MSFPFPLPKVSGGGKDIEGTSVKVSNLPSELYGSTVMHRIWDVRH